MDIGCYPMSMSRMIVGSQNGKPFLNPIGIEAKGELSSRGIDLNASAELLFENGIVDWDYSNSTVKVFDGIKKSWETITFNESDNEMYLKEISHVVKCINDKIPSTIIDLNNGINTFKISERIKHKSH